MSTIVVPFHLDQRIDRFESPLGVDRTVAPELPSGGAWGRMAALYEDVAQAVSGDPAPIVVSGDCTTSIATVAGLAQAGDSPGIVWRDLDPAEDELLASAAVRRASVEGLRVDDLPAGPLYLHLDVDVADPADLPGLLFPRPWRSWPERADRCGRDGCELGPARRGRGRAHLGR